MYAHQSVRKAIQLEVCYILFHFFLSSAQKSQKVVAVVDPCAAKFGDGLTLVMVLKLTETTKKHSPQEPRTEKRTQTAADI